MDIDYMTLIGIAMIPLGIAFLLLGVPDELRSVEPVLRYGILAAGIILVLIDNDWRK